MTQIAYVVGGLWRHHPGLHAKVLGAAQVWEQMGAHVSIILFSEGRVVDAWGDTLTKETPERVGKLESYYNTDLGKLTRFFGLRHQYRYLKEVLAKLKPDVVYSRYSMPVPGIQRVFGSVCPYVIEVNSDDLIEYGLKNRITGIYNSFFRKFLLDSAAGLCFISRELAASQSFSWYKGNKAVVANSIHCDSFPFVEDTGNQRVNVCFIGSPNQSWHGLDKVRALSELFPEWLFHIIGPEREEFSFGFDSLPENLIFHGYLSGESAKNLLKSIDVGISTLALHRKQMNEASPLKSRQYLAQGIPLICAYEDTDVPRREFICSLPNTETGVSECFDEVEAFVGKVFRNTELRSQAREFAESFLDSSVIEKDRLLFIQSCI